MSASDEAWSAALKSGEPLMDAEHEFQVAHIDRVEEQLRTGEDAKVRQETISDLLEFTSAHCAVEARMMHTMGYPRMQEHVGAHVELLEQLRDIEQQHAAGDCKALMTIENLREWLAEHIKQHDFPFAQWCRVKRGSTQA